MPAHDTSKRATGGITRLLDRLEGARQVGPGRYQALCPAHNDRGPSLSVRLDGDRILLHCHAGCSVEDVVAALGLSMQDLFLTPLPPGQRRALARAHDRAPLVAAAKHELLTAYLLLCQPGRDPDDEERLHLAANRLPVLLNRLFGEGAP